MKLGAIAVLSLLSATAVHATQITAVPALTNNADVATRNAPATMLLNDDTSARAIELGALKPAETPKAANRSASMRRTHQPGAPLRIGVSRTVPASSANVRLADLPWHSVAGGGTAARVILTSDGAVALRLGVQVADAPEGLALRFHGSGETYGPVAASAMPKAYPYWSPVLMGERAVVELALPAGVAPGNATLQLPLVSHLLLSPTSTKADPDPFDLIGAAGTCEMDVACLSSPSTALLNAQSATSRIVFTYEGETILCSATLVNDSINSKTPYIYAANHCIDDFAASDDLLISSKQASEAASSTNTYWFFQAATCGSLATPNYVLLTAGARLLARGFDYDWALLQLNEPPPAGATFSAWRAETVPATTAVTTLHHPEGDLTKVSTGTVFDYITFLDGSSFIETRWTQGVTEAGSSGGGLFTLSPDGTTFELRGASPAGEDLVVPHGPAGLDQYSRLDNGIPLLSQYLTPNTPLPDGAVPAVEFYNEGLNDFFLTVDPGEINDLDTGVHAGWIRTGYRFLAYPPAAVAPTSASPVCRFYVLPAVGDSHFYSADPNECAETQAKFAGQWVFESPNAFSIDPLP